MYIYDSLASWNCNFRMQRSFPTSREARATREGSIATYKFYFEIFHFFFYSLESQREREI